MKNLTLFTIFLCSFMMLFSSCKSEEEGNDDGGNTYIINASFLLPDEGVNAISLNDSEEKTINFSLALDNNSPAKVTIAIVSEQEKVNEYKLYIAFF